MLYAFVCIDCTVCVRYACVGRCTHSFCLKCQYVSEECDLLFIQNPRATFSKYATCLAIRLFALRGVKLLHNLPIACLSARQAQPLTQLSLPLRFFPPLLGDFFFLFRDSQTISLEIFRQIAEEYITPKPVARREPITMLLKSVANISTARLLSPSWKSVKPLVMANANTGLFRARRVASNAITASKLSALA